MYLKYYLQWYALMQQYVFDEYRDYGNPNYRYPVMSLEEYEKEVKRRENLK